MKYCSTAITFATLASTILAAYVPSDPWTGLTPDSPAPTGATTDHTHPFGIQIVSVAASAAAKRAIDQITDGQIQANSATLATPSPTVIQQISDGQIQQQTTAQPIQQIGDGQIQHQTTVTPIQQIGDGQIQNPTGTAANQISDGQVQQTGSPASDDGTPQACGTDTTLSMSITGGILTDSQGRIGAIVANRQFQFDGPPPQAGTIYAAGWSITSDGYLALGSSTQFYQCLSGDFYNLYDQSIGGQCTEIKLSIVDLVTC